MNVGKIRLFAALVALVALAGAIGYGTRTAEADVTGAAKTCTRVDAITASCTLTVTVNSTGNPAANAITVALTSSPVGATFSGAPVFGPATGGGTVANIGFGATTITFTLNCATGPCSVPITETISITGAATTLTQTVTDSAGPPPNTIVATATVPAAPPAPPAAPTATKTCAATGATTASCTFAISFPTPLAPGITTVAVSGAGVTVTGATLIVAPPAPSCGTVSVTGNTITINASTPAACTGLTITETVSGLAAGTANTISQSATFSGAGAAFGTVTASTTVTTAAPTFSITCTSTPGAPALTTFNAFVPSTPSPIAVGIVPSAVACAVNVGTLDPGVVEISSVNGLLVSSSGTLTTNLRIPCGTSGVAGSCTGAINFLVAAGGVGAVTVQARYEPAPTSTSTERETSATIVFVAPSVLLTLSLNPNPVAVGQNGTAQVTFLVQVTCAPGAAAVGAGPACVDVSTGTIISAVPSSSVLSGTVLFSIDNTSIARWTGAVTAPAPGTTPTPPPVSTSGFTTSPNQVAVRCGFFPTSAVPSSTTIGAFFPIPSLSSFFGGCTAAQAQYQGVAPGAATVSAQFIPDLPGAFANIPGTGVPAQVQALFGFVGASNIAVTRTLEVLAAAPSGRIELSRGCNNVSPTVTEAAADYAKRVSPSGALVAIWEHQAATNTFRGWSPQAGAPNDLAQVTRLRPVFICVSGPATLDQPAA